MRIIYSKQFVKQLRKVPPPIQHAFRNRLELFLHQPDHPQLRFHALQGELIGRYSINITGDWRAVFRFLDEGITVFFVAIGTHSQLYR